jgi:hypothetical protein
MKWNEMKWNEMKWNEMKWNEQVGEAHNLSSGFANLYKL